VPEGRKYNGAVHWEKTVLRADWLTSCFLQKSRINETNFLVGSTKVSQLNKISPEETDDIPCSQDVLVEKSPPEKRKSSPISPGTPIRCDFEVDENGKVSYISMLCDELTTPAREITKAVLRENQRKKNENMSPRMQKLKDLMKTPGVNGRNIVEEVSSPAPALPSCMKKTDRTYGLFDDASPYTQYQYKCKLDILDSDYVHLSDSKKKELRNVSETPNYNEMRRDFFKRRMPEFQSPLNAASQDTDSQSNMSKEASKFLNFGDSERISPKRKSSEIDDFSSLEMLLKEARESSAKKARASERLEYEAQKSAKSSFCEPSQNDDNKMLVDEHTQNDGINWISTQTHNVPPRSALTCGNTESSAAFHRPKSLPFRMLSEMDYDDEGAEEQDIVPDIFTDRSVPSKQPAAATEEDEEEEEKQPLIFGISCGNSSVSVS
jgi:hypothetical protein